MYMYMYMYTYMHMYMYMYMYMYIYIYVCVCVCVDTYIYNAYIHVGWNQYGYCSFTILAIGCSLSWFTTPKHPQSP